MNKKVDVVRAWRDEEYRDSLTEEQRASLPENPAGLAQVADSVLRSIAGGCGVYYWSKECYPGSTPYHSCVAPHEACP